jgi:hypothetical protein
MQWVSINRCQSAHIHQHLYLSHGIIKRLHEIQHALQIFDWFPCVVAAVVTEPTHFVQVSLVLALIRHMAQFRSWTLVSKQTNPRVPCIAPSSQRSDRHKTDCFPTSLFIKIEYMQTQRKSLTAPSRISSMVASKLSLCQCKRTEETRKRAQSARHGPCLVREDEEGFFQGFL